MSVLTTAHAALAAELRQLIEDARLRAAVSVNAELTGLYRQVGRRIHREILGSQRAKYGEEIVSALSRQLSADYGRGFSAQNLRHMVQFAQAFPDQEIVSALRRQLSWTHLKSLIYLDDPLKREFYIDLLLYNRRLRRLVAVELKVGEFRPEYKGQMELYLRWLARHEQEAGEDSPLGIILCTGKKQEQIELLELDKCGIHVAEYLTVLPPRETLQAKLHQSIANARQRFLQVKEREGFPWLGGSRP